MKKVLLGILAVLSLLATIAVSADEWVTKVNGTAIPQARIDLRVKASGQADSPELRKAVREEMINLEVLGQEATRLGLNKIPEAVQQLELARLSVLSGVFVQDYLNKHPVSDSQIQQEYERMKPSLGGTEFNIRHILLANDRDAKEIIAQLGKGADFEKLAAEKSKDTNSAGHGGALGWSLPGIFVPQIGKAIQSLQKGSYSKQPVLSPLGWHVIKLDDVRERKVAPLETLKPQIVQYLQQQILQKVIADLRIKARVE